MDDIQLDGRYNVSSTSNYHGPLERKSDGVTEIRNGQTMRFDENGVMWRSTFRAISETEVEMTSVADPSEAKSGFALTLPNGAPTREPVTYKTILKLARKGERLQMSGQMEYGNEIIFLTMRKIDEAA